MSVTSLDLRLLILYPILFPVLLTAWPVFYIYKKFVIVLAKWRRKNLRNIVDDNSSYLVEDFSKVNLTKCSEICGLLLNGDITIEQLRELFTRNVLEAQISEGGSGGVDSTPKMGNHGKIRYPELKQYQTPFMGYVYWKDEDDFDINVHITEGPSEWEVLDEAEIHEKLLNKPFHPKLSPWEVILLRGCNSNQQKSLIFLRFHHSMVDGQSIFKLIVEGLGQQSFKKPGIDMKPSNDLKFYLTFPLKFSWMVYSCFRTNLLSWRHLFKLRNIPSLNEQIPVQVRFSEKILLENVKSISKRFGVTTSSVIMSIVAGALKGAIPNLGDSPCAYILPKSGHPATFTNHFYLASVMLPSGNTSSKERLIICHKNLEEVKNFGYGFYTEASVKPLHSFISPIRQLIFPDFVGTMGHIGITNNSISEKAIFIGGRLCEDISFSVGTFQGTMGLNVIIANYNRFLRFVISADRGIISTSVLEDIMVQIGNEFNELFVT